jgi:tetratricopeptide (TPR) repeat protein
MIKVRLITIILIIIIWSLFLPINYFVNTNVNASSTTAPPPSSSPQSNLEEEEEEVNSLYSNALEAIEQGMYEEAIGYLDAILAIEPDNVLALNKTGYSLYNLGRLDEAIGYYDRALAVEPNHVGASIGKGDALYYLERYEEAIEYYDRALAIESATIAEDVTQTSSINREGQVIWITNSNLDDGAQLHYITVFLTSKTAIDAQYNKGIAFFQEGRYQEAIDIFESILTNDDRHIDSLYYAAQRYEKLGYIEQANQYMNMVYQIDPNYQGRGEGFIQNASTAPVIQAIMDTLHQLASAITG